MSRTIAAAMLACLISTAALADERAVRKMIAERAPQAHIESVRPLGSGALYEVVLRGARGPEVIYADREGRFLVVGTVLDVRSGRNLTEERVRALTAIDWKALPFADAITMKRGRGRREIAVFSDPNCPYCKRFEEDLARLNDLTVHIFPYPVIKEESVRQAKSAWCSPDRAKAWNELMFNRVEPRAKTDCENPIERNVALGQRLGATSTPTWFLRTGERHSGAMPMKDLVPLLDAARPKSGP